MKKIIKKRIQQELNRFGYYISRTPPLSDAFTVQSRLIRKKNPVILDIGANAGSVTRIYRERFPYAFIHSFEPYPQSFRALSNSFEGDSRIFCHQKAVSDLNGAAALNANLRPATNSLLPTDNRGVSFWGEGLLDTVAQIEVSTTTIDTFCDKEGISNIDILKMDVQGAEFSVLKGAGEMLASQRISLIYTEIIMCPTYEGQHKFHEYISFLDFFGYDFLDLFNPVKRDNQVIQADVVFLSSSLKTNP